MLTEIQKKTIITLLAQEQPYLHDRKKRALEITETDPHGWVLRHELELKESPLYPRKDNRIKSIKRYFEKSVTDWFNDDLIAPLIDKRAKGTRYRKESNPLKFKEKVKGGYKSRKGSAYRLKRNKSTWRKVALLAIENDFFPLFICSPYNLEHPNRKEYTIAFYTCLSGLIEGSEQAEAFQADIERKRYGREVALSEKFALEFTYTFEEFLTNTSKFREQIKELAKKTDLSPSAITHALMLSDTFARQGALNDDWKYRLFQLDGALFADHAHVIMWGDKHKLGIMAFLEEKYPQIAEEYNQAYTKKFDKGLQIVKKKLPREAKQVLEKREETIKKRKRKG